MHRLAYLVLLSLPAGLAADGSSAPVYPPTKDYRHSTILGWTVLTHPALIEKRPDLVRETHKHLEAQLYQVVHRVPAPHVEKMKKVRIWIEDFHPLHPCMCYHPDPGWLRGKKCNPDKARCVEISHPINFLDWTRNQPWMVLHELAHAYHHQVLPESYGNAELHQAWARMKETGKYDSVLHIDGRKRRHYALTTPMEYFAESTEAYFGTNDFYPFVRAELREFDPAMFALLEKIWKK